MNVHMWRSNAWVPCANQTFKTPEKLTHLGGPEGKYTMTTERALYNHLDSDPGIVSRNKDTKPLTPLSID